MHADTVAVWKLIKEAGTTGLLMDEIKAALPQIPDVPKRVTNLRGMSYIRPTSDDKRPRYAATSKVPLAAIEAGDDDADDDEAETEAIARAEARSKAPRGVPPGVPSSVFHLAQLTAGAAAADDDVAQPRSVTTREQHHQADREYFVPRFQPEPLSRGAGPWGDAPVAPTPQGQVFKPATPHFELHSDGVLVIDAAGDGTEPISLPPTLTRHLFRWLDQLSGLHLSRLVATDTEAAS